MAVVLYLGVGLNVLIFLIFNCVCFVFWWGVGVNLYALYLGWGESGEKMVYVTCLGRNGHQQCPPGLAITASKKTSIPFLLGLKGWDLLASSLCE